MKKNIYIKIIAISFLTIISLTGFFFFKNINESGWSIEEREIIFKIEKGDSVFTISEKLQEEGVISNKYVFITYVFLENERKNLQMGDYMINDEMNITEIVNMFVSGNVFYENITFIEGWTIRDMAKYLEREEISKEDDFFSIVGISKPQANLIGVEERNSIDLSDEFLILKDKPIDSSLEGYLFPDTYRLDFDDIEVLVRKMISNLDSKFSEDFQKKAEEKERTIHEIIIMASIIEKEVIEMEDKRKVSDILWRRIEIGMPLQVDASVNYVTGRRGVDVTITETKTSSPYNTYENRGLPKGPISNPGIESIEAALYPLENDYWYYLSDQETKKTIFSRNYNDHIRAKNKYLR